MSRRIIDLTLPMKPHWRYALEYKPVKTHENGDPWQSSKYELESHWYTHIDAPLHFQPGGKTLSDFPIEDWAVSTCLVLNLSYVESNQGITAEMLEKANEPFKEKHYDTILIRTDWGKRMSWEDERFWLESPYVTEDGGIWIRDYAPKVVGYDIPQDYDIRKIRGMKPGDVIWQPVHEHVLVEGQILQIEYLTNLWNIKSPVCTLCALPLATVDRDGTQIRVVAVVED